MVLISKWNRRRFSSALQVVLVDTFIFRFKMNSSVDSSMTMSDRLLMEPTFDMDDEEEVMEREEGETGDEDKNKNEEQEVNNLDVGGEVENCDRVVSVGGDQEELEELEQSLQALERLDRSSPDLWPDQVGSEMATK